MFYAMFDLTVHKGNPGYGFANSKAALAFRTKKEREQFLKDREYFDFTAKALSRGDALKMVEQVYDDPHDKGLYVNKYLGEEMVVLRHSPYGRYQEGQIV